MSGARDSYFSEVYEQAQSFPIFIQSPMARWMLSRQAGVEQVPCPHCEGTKQYKSKPCPFCNATGLHLLLPEDADDD